MGNILRLRKDQMLERLQVYYQGLSTNAEQQRLAESWLAEIVHAHAAGSNNRSRTSREESITEELMTATKTSLNTDSPGLIAKQYAEFDAAVVAKKRKQSYLIPPEGWPLFGRKSLKKDDESAWLGMIIDEVGDHRNPSNNGLKALARVPAQLRPVMTGTPLQNNPRDLFAPLRMVHHYMGKELRRLNTVVGKPAKKHDLEPWYQIQRECMLQLGKYTLIDGKPVVDLPAKERLRYDVTFDAAEIVIYDLLNCWLAETIEKFHIADLGYESVLQAITRLRQACLDPRVILTSDGFETLADLSGGEQSLESSTEDEELAESSVEDEEWSDDLSDDIQSQEDLSDVSKKPLKLPAGAEGLIKQLPPDVHPSKTKMLLKLLNELRDDDWETLGPRNRFVVFSEYIIKSRIFAAIIPWPDIPLVC